MPTFDNAWLRARESTRHQPDTTRDIMHSPKEQARRMALADGDGSDPVAEARAYLAQAPDYSDIAGIPDRLAELQSGSRPSLEALTGPLARVGQGAQVASLPAAFVPGGQGVAAGLGVGGTVLQIPDMLRRALNNDPSDDPGMGEGGMALLGMVPGIKGLAKAGKVRGISDLNRPLGPSRYESAIGAVDSPNFQRAEGIAKSVPSTGLPSAWTRLMGKSPSAAPAKARPDGFSADWLQTIKSQGRTTPPIRPELQQLGDGEDAWSSLRTLATRKETAAGDPFGSVKDLVGGPSERAVDLTSELAGLSTLDRAAQQARAQQRFGRVFRSE